MRAEEVAEHCLSLAVGPFLTQHPCYEGEHDGGYRHSAVAGERQRTSGYYVPYFEAA